MKSTVAASCRFHARLTGDTASLTWMVQYQHGHATREASSREAQQVGQRPRNSFLLVSATAESAVDHQQVEWLVLMLSFRRP